jgi:hypothetical protein
MRLLGVGHREHKRAGRKAGMYTGDPAHTIATGRCAHLSNPRPTRRQSGGDSGVKRLRSWTAHDRDRTGSRADRALRPGGERTRADFHATREQNTTLSRTVSFVTAVASLLISVYPECVVYRGERSCPVFPS